MKRSLQQVRLLLVALGGCAIFPGCENESSMTGAESLIEYVDPFIGTGGKGKTYPGASAPFGMVQLSPDNGRNGWDWISGYFYPDSVIAGFSHTHLTGTGAGDLYDISFMPLSGKARRSRLDTINTQFTTYSTFSHDREEASPGYYRVYLEDYQVDVELTASERTGWQRYTFQDPENPRVKLDLGYSRNWDRTTLAGIQVLNDSTIAGFRHSSGWAKDQRVYFYSIFSQPFEAVQISADGALLDRHEAEGADIKAVMDFDLTSGASVVVKTGISMVDLSGALKNLERVAQAGGFDQIRQEVEAAWEQELSKVKVDATRDNMTQFYTAMYHSMLAPITFSDVDGRFRGADGEIHEGPATRYSLFSLWDTFRAWHPLATILHLDRVPDMINSMLAHYQESGLLPVWEFHGNETNMMLGYHAVPAIVDALKKGIAGIDTMLAYDAIKKSAMQDDFHIDQYKALGYVPFDAGSWNVSLTMEYAFDDWCIAQMAKHLSNDTDYKYFSERSANYRSHFDTTTQFFRARDASGNFREPFDPTAYHPEDYAEANAWQYLWFVPHDVAGLVELSGGEDQFEERLDALFEGQAAQEAPVWISGAIGQYIHGNEPSHHVPYLYQFVGASSKTQQRVRQIMRELYTTQPAGLCGNEDCGQMSAWYIFSALGFYPVNPAAGVYVLGSPEISKAEISLPNNKKFIVEARNQSEEHVYIQSILLNGATLEAPFITHQQIMNGGQLIFEMSDTPNDPRE